MVSTYPDPSRGHGRRRAEQGWPRVETGAVPATGAGKGMSSEAEGDFGDGRTMDWPPPTATSPSLVVRSPRQTVSLLRHRRQHRDTFPRSPSFAAGDHGPKPSEVYGFVGSITTVIATAIYLAWAYTPEPWLHSIGITYYPSKYWALAVPSFVIVAVVVSMVIYMGLNFLATPPPTSFNTIFDENSREGVMYSPTMNEEERPIEPISDMSIDQINNLMFGDK